MDRGQQAAEPLNTAAVSAAAGYPAQQIRDLEAPGVIPALRAGIAAAA